MENERTIARIMEAVRDYGTAWCACDAMAAVGYRAAISDAITAALAAKDAEIADLKQRLTDSGCDLQAPTPESGEWVEWNGGKCPIADGVKFQFKFRDGSQCNDYACTNAPEWIWANRGYGGDIVAYRIIP